MKTFVNRGEISCSMVSKYAISMKKIETYKIVMFLDMYIYYYKSKNIKICTNFIIGNKGDYKCISNVSLLLFKVT